MAVEVEIAARRVLGAYALMFNEAKAESMREVVINHLRDLFAQGQTDEERLAVHAMCYLKGADGSALPRGAS